MVQQAGDPDVFVTSRVFETPKTTIPGIGAAAAYAAGDAFGDKFILLVPPEGTISNIVFLDLDDEGIQKDLVLFREDFTATADNAAFAVSDDDLGNCIGIVTVNVFYNFSNNQVGIGTPAFAYRAPSGRLFCQFVTQGADNIAAGSEPKFFLVVT